MAEEQDGGVLVETGSQYRPVVGLIFVFNLIVGTGALTMPKAFGEAGWLLSLLVILLLAFISFVTVTFVNETMGNSNAIYTTRPRSTAEVPNGPVPVQAEEADPDRQLDEQAPLLAPHGDNPFEMKKRFEMGQMAKMYYKPWGVTLFYICIALYLYGDLAIYAAAVPKSLRDVACTNAMCSHAINGTNATANVSCQTNMTDADPCWPGLESVSRINAYRIFLAVFIVLLGAFIFFNVQKTKWLQIITTILRWLAFAMMIVLAIIKLSKGQGQGRPPVADAARLPTLFGVCVYSFMCHHSLPSLVTPISDRSRLTALFAGDYVLIAGFYVLLSMTGVFTFSKLEDLYTLNFQPGTGDFITDIKFIQYFLALFPVFTLSTNFPIIGITLRNNLKTIFYIPGKSYPFVIDRILFPLLTIIPPLIIALATDNVELLVGLTGSYMGAGIQYVIPATLVFYSRRQISKLSLPHSNIHASPFGHVTWVILVFVWSVICVVFVTVNFALYGL